MNDHTQPATTPASAGHDSARHPHPEALAHALKRERAYLVALLAAMTDEQREQMLQRVCSVAAEIRKIAEAAMPGVIAAAAELNRAMEALRTAGLLDEQYRPVAPSDRPAWQSPYGPARRRH